MHAYQMLSPERMASIISQRDANLGNLPLHTLPAASSASTHPNAAATPGPTPPPADVIMPLKKLLALLSASGSGWCHAKGSVAPLLALRTVEQQLFLRLAPAAGGGGFIHPGAVKEVDCNTLSALVEAYRSVWSSYMASEESKQV